MGFAILIIFAIGGLAAAGVGLGGLGAHQGWWSAGTLCNLSQVQSMIMMGIGGTGGILLFIVGIVGMVKARQRTIQTLARISPPLLPLSSSKLIEAHGSSYTSKDSSGNLDLLHCNNTLGFGYVVDGTGHNNPNMKGPLEEHFKTFERMYCKNLSSINTLEKMTEHFTTRIRQLEQQFNNPELKSNQIKVCPSASEAFKSTDKQLGTFLDPTYKPAMSFFQLVRTPNQLLLLTAQAGDTMIVVEMNNQEVHTTQGSNASGVGDLQSSMPIQIFDITGAKRIIGFSDGIGEFVTQEELVQAIRESNNREDDFLFAKLKSLAMSTRTSMGLSANGSNLKQFKENDPKHTDDMALFVYAI